MDLTDPLLTSLPDFKEFGSDLLAFHYIEENKKKCCGPLGKYLLAWDTSIRNDIEIELRNLSDETGMEWDTLKTTRQLKKWVREAQKQIREFKKTRDTEDYPRVEIFIRDKYGWINCCGRFGGMELAGVLLLLLSKLPLLHLNFEK